MPNNFNQLSKSYRKTAYKPDKQFSTLPTILKLAQNFQNKIVLDLGCGGGFFTNIFACGGAKKVFGIDNSTEQIRLAKKKRQKNVAYILGDIFTDTLPRADIILAPYVINYAADYTQLTNLFQNIYNSLFEDGKFIAVVDLPDGKNLKRFGAIKNVCGHKKDGAKIEIQLFNNENFICSLSATYFTPKTLENALVNVGFRNITWHTPIVSYEGIRKMGDKFWDGYTESPELGYITAVKK